MYKIHIFPGSLRWLTLLVIVTIVLPLLPAGASRAAAPDWTPVATAPASVAPPTGDVHYLVGGFTKTIGTAPISQVITHNLGFTPKALILWTAGQTAQNVAANYRYALGFSDGVTSYSFAAASQSNVSPSNSSQRFAAKALTLVQWGEVLLAEANLVGWNTTTFTLNWTTNNTSAYIIHYMIIGGAGVTAKVVNWQAPTVTGPKAVTGVGFRPDLVLHINGSNSLTSAAPSSKSAAEMALGAMNAAGEQWVVASFANDNDYSTPFAVRGQRTDAAFAATSASHSGMYALRASYGSMDPDGFTLNFNQVANAVQAVSLALKGVESTLGSFNAPTHAPTTQIITGIGIRPAALFLTTWGHPAETNVLSDARFALGASDGMRQGAIAVTENDKLNTENYALQSTQRIVYRPNIGGSLGSEALLSSLDSNGFTLNWQKTDTTESDQYLYLALAAAPLPMIGDRVWADQNRNSVQDLGEPGLANVRVQLYEGICADRAGQTARATTTDANGYYSFVITTAGAYCVTVDPVTVPSGYIATTEMARDVTHDAQQVIGDVDFGFVAAVADDRLAVGAYAPCLDATWLQQLAQTYSATITSQNVATCGYTLQVAPANLAALQAAVVADPHDRHAGPDVLTHGDFTPNDPDYSNPSKVYGPQQINAPAAWDATTGDPNLIVAIVDTGIDRNHPEFAGRLLAGYDFVNKDTDPTDDNGHGTHVAGIAAAGINNGIGMAGMAGTAQILPVKVLAANNTGWWSDVANGVTWAVDQGAKVINLSLNGSTDAQAMRDAVAYAQAKQVLVVVAAGNGATSEPTYPASYPDVLSLGGTTNTGVRYNLSNYGPNVDAMAPGASIWSTYWSATAGSTYKFMSGTSMAAPHAAGVAALLYSRNPNLTPAQVKEVILTTATDMEDPGVDVLTGYGLINAQAAVAAVPMESAAAPQTELMWELAVDVGGNGVVDPGDTLRYLVTVANSGATPLSNVVVSATAPIYTSYVISSTRLSGIPVRDDAAPKTALPLDEGGLNIGSVPAGGSAVVSFDVVVGQPSRGIYAVVGQVTVTTSGGPQELQTVTPVAGTLLRAAVSQPSAQISQTLTYSLTTDYLGSQLLNSVVVTAAVPSGSTYVADSANAGGVEGGNVLTWTLGSNTPGVNGYRAPSAYKVGSFTKAAGAAPASQTITHNLGVAPKALILWTDGKTDESFSPHYLFGYGFSDGASSKSAAASSQDNVSPDNAARRIANKALTIVQYDQTLLAEADLAAWDSASLTLNWTTNNSVAYVVHYLIIGGADVSAKTLGWAMNSGNGNTAVTGAGFRPDLVLHVNVGSGLTATPPATGANAGMSLGAMNAAGEQWAMAVLASDARNPSRAGRGQRTDAAILALALDGTNPSIDKQASFVSMDADGFTVNFTSFTFGFPGQMISLALKGIGSKVGSLNKATGSAPATQAITGVGFQPAAVLLHSFQDVAQANAIGHARLGLGASDGANQGSSAFQATNNVSTSSVDGIDKTSKVFIKMNNNTPAVDAEANLSSLGADGFTLNWTTNDAVATQLLYLALSPAGVGNALSAGPTLVTTGGLITVTQVLTASQNIANVIPSALTITATNGVTATLLSGPTPASATVGITGTTFTWVYGATAAGNIGQLIFAGGATGASVAWPRAQTNSVIVHPPLTFQTTVVGEPAAGGPIQMTAFIHDAGGLLPSNASNTPTTGLFGSIGDRVWNDQDGDAIQDAREPGMSGVTVCATPAGGGATLCTVTDAAGYYGFADLPTATYTVTVDAASLPAETLFRTTPYPIVHTLVAGETFLAADFGFRGLGVVIGDSLWYDADADGVQDAGEPGLGNISLALWLDDGDGIFEPVPGLDSDYFVDTTISDAAGAYRFDAPTAGTYFVDVTDDYGLLAGLAHTVGPQSMNDPTPAILVTLGQFYTAADFGYVRVPPAEQGVIGDLVWVDGNGDGHRQLTEPALIGVQVCATPAAGGSALCTTTDSNGRYLLVAPAGEYLVTPNTGPLGLIPASPSTLGVHLAAGSQALGVDFPFVSDGTPLGTIGGLVWQDVAVNDQTDGTYDPAHEPGIPQVSIGLIKDSDEDGVWDSGEPYIATFTILDGTYSFPFLPGGAYLLRVTDSRRVLRYFVPTVGAEGGGAGGAPVSKAQPYPVTLAAGSVDESGDFGYRELEVFGAADPPDPGMIGDRVWLDVDGNGVYDPAAGDEPLAGVTVAAYDGAGALVGSATTGLDGVYLFTGLALADYTIRVTDEFGALGSLLPTLEGAGGAGDVNQAQPYTVSLGLVEADFSADFGYARPTALAGVVFVDQNNNGVQDMNETLVLKEVSITLADGVGNQETVATATDGAYTFSGLRPGLYSVSAPPVWQGFVLTTAGVVTLTVGVSGADSGPAFGYISPTAVQLTDFAATARDAAVQLTWRLALWGRAAPAFDVWRAAGGASWKRLTAMPVAPAASDAETASYTFTDPAIEAGVTYAYRLVSTTGEVFGPWSVRVPATSDVRRFLPLVSR